LLFVAFSGQPMVDPTVLQHRDTQTNTGRFSNLVDFDHTGMDDKEFREALKGKLAKIREASPGNK
jgi:hypothetical protein